MSESDNIKIQVTSQANTQGLDDAKKKVDALGASAKETSKGLDTLNTASEKAGKATAQTGKDMDDAARGANNLTKDLRGLSGVASRLPGPLGQVAGMLGRVISLLRTPGGIATAGIGAAIMVLDKIRASVKKTQEELAAVTAEKMKQELEGVGEAQRKWNEEIENTATLRKQQEAELDKELNALKAHALAVNELTKARELANAQTDDERKAIELKYRGFENDITGKFDKNIGANKLAGIESDIQDIEAKIKRAQQARDEYAAKQEELLKKSELFMSQGTAYDRASTWRTMGSTLTGGWINQAGQPMRKSGIAFRNEAGKYEAEAQGQDAAIEKMRNQLAQELKKAETQRTSNQAAEMRAQAREVSNTTETRQHTDTVTNNQRREEERRAGLAAAQNDLAREQASLAKMRADVEQATEAKAAARDAHEARSGEQSEAATRYKRDRSLGNKSRLDAANKALSEAGFNYNAAVETLDTLTITLAENEKEMEQRIRELERTVLSLTKEPGGIGKVNPQAGMSPFNPAPVQGAAPLSNAVADAMQGMTDGGTELGDAVIRNAEANARANARTVARLDALTQQLDRDNTENPAAV